jgi:hypothetical protein
MISRTLSAPRLLGRVDLALADAVDVVQDLALQVRRVDDVHVDDAERPHTGGREVHGGGGAQAARAEEQHLRLEELLLAGLADLGQEHVAVVPVALLRREDLRCDPGAALVLPAPETALQRGDVGIAELTEGLGRERRPVAGGAVDDDRLVLRDLVLDLAFEVAAGDEHRAGDGPLLVLVELADVEERGIAEAFLGLGRGDLVDVLLGLGQELAVAGHPGSSRSFALSRLGRAKPVALTTTGTQGKATPGVGYSQVPPRPARRPPRADAAN